MKVTKEKVAENRDAMVAAAARLFREAGIDGVSVADLTAAAGLTHGGFYRHFDSKEALFQESCLKSCEDATSMIQGLKSKPDGDRHFHRAYLSETHINETPFCPVATLATEVGRQGPAIQQAFASGLRKLLSSSGHDIGTAEWNKSAAELATLVGTFIMARAVRLADKPLAKAVVNAGLDVLSAREKPKKKSK